MSLTYWDAQAYLGGIGRKLVRGCLLICIVKIILHYFSAKDDNRFGRASMAMDGKNCPWFNCIEDSLTTVLRCGAQVKRLPQSRILFCLLRKSVKYYLIKNHISYSLTVYIIDNRTIIGMVG